MTIQNNIKQKFEIYTPVVVNEITQSLSTIDCIYNNSLTFDKKLKEIAKQVFINPTDIELDNLYDSLKDEEYREYLGTEVISQYMIVAAYSLFEKSIKIVLKLSDRFINSDFNGFNADKLKTLLLDKFNISFSSLNESNALEELRWLNNSIKHEGKINQQFAATNPKWNKEQLILKISMTISSD